MDVDPAIKEESATQFEAAIKAPSKRLAVVVLVGLLVVFILSAIIKPSVGEYFTVCGFKNFTGLPCPGCGLTHSFCALGHGDVINALGFNLLGPPLFLVFVLAWIRSASVLLNRRDVVQLFDRLANRFNLVKTFAFAFAAFGIARIAYLVIFHQITFSGSPLWSLISR